MSTELKHYTKTIQGELYTTQFFAGKKHGLSLQLTVVGSAEQHGCPLNSRYVQLNKAQVQELVRDLQDWLGETELPFFTEVYKRHVKDNEDGLPCSCGKPVDDPIHIRI